MFISASPASLTAWIWASVVVVQSFGRTINSVESNLITSLGDTVNRYFQIYPSFCVPAAAGSKSVKDGSSSDTFPLASLEPGAPELPLSKQT